MFLTRSNTKPSFLLAKPTPSFLSPAHKYNQRSYSASSSYHSEKHLLPNHPHPNLRQQIRLQSFKKSIMAESKLNKTNLKKATLKLHSYESNNAVYEKQRLMSSNGGSVEQKRQNSREVSSLLKQNEQLKTLRNQDLLLISRQNQLILSLENNHHPPNHNNNHHINNTHHHMNNNSICIQEYRAKICNYEIKIEHLQQQLKEYKTQIRDIVYKHEEIKHKMHECQEKYREQIHINRKLESLLDEIKQNRDREADARAKEETNAKIMVENCYAHNRQRVGCVKTEVRVDNRRRQYGKIVGSPTSKMQIKDNGVLMSGNKDLQRYYDYLGKLRNKQIDTIDHILKQ